MHAGLPKYLPVNLKDIEAAGFQEGEEVSLESLKNKGLINPSGRERRLPLKVMIMLEFNYYHIEKWGGGSSNFSHSSISFKLIMYWFSLCFFEQTN